jgi:toxin ParE1/3/4
VTGRTFYTAAARADLRSIAAYIAQDSPERAATYVREIRAHCRRLAQRRRMHRLREEYGSGVRAAVHGLYLVLYTIRADETVVVSASSMRHGANCPRSNLTDPLTGGRVWWDLASRADLSANRCFAGGMH